MSWASRARLRTLAVGVAVAVGLVASAGAAGAAEVYPRPADGGLDLTGHGWGHGIGMSQYGAKGGADAGQTWQQIVGHYYTGTTIGSIGNPTIRVRVASLGSAIQALPASGLAISWTGTSPVVLRDVVQPGEAPVVRWRFVSDPLSSTKVRVEYLTQGSVAWRHFTTSPGGLAMFLNQSSGTVTTFRGSAPVVYRHQVRAARTVSGGALVPVVALPLESYLRSVVPNEMPASWDRDAVSAQAVAARSFAEHHRRYAPLSPSWYDVYDDTRSQVFKGTRVGTTNYENPDSDAAIAATANQAVMYGTTVAFTQFSSSSGGWTATGSQPYLKAKADPWDAVAANPNHTWTTRVSVASIEGSFPSIGSFLSMSITGRTGNGDQGGRVTQAVLRGSAGSVTTTGNGLRSALGLKSDWFKPAQESAASFPRDVTGDRRMDVLAVVAGSGALRVYAGNGSGGWKAATVPEGSGWNSYAKALTAGTWDADTISDVLVQNSAGDLFLRSGLGNGTFGTARKIGAGWTMHDLVLPVGDFDGDGLTDLVARRASGGALWLYSGNGTGGFKSQRIIGGGWQIFTAIFSPGDFNGDGDPDVLARTADGSLYLYPGNGSGGWEPRVKVGLGWHTFTALTSGGDFNGDGKSDVLARTSSGLLYLYPGNGSGGWKPRSAVGNGWQIFSTILR